MRHQKIPIEFICKFIAGCELSYAIASLTFYCLLPPLSTWNVPSVPLVTGTILLLGLLTRSTGYLKAWIIIRGLYSLLTLLICGFFATIFVIQTAVPTLEVPELMMEVSTLKVLVFSVESLLVIALIPLVHLLESSWAGSYSCHLPSAASTPYVKNNIQYMEMTPTDAEKMLSKNFYC